MRQKLIPWFVASFDTIHGNIIGDPLQGGPPPQNHNLQSQRKSY